MASPLSVQQKYKSMRAMVVDSSGVMRKVISRALGEVGIKDVEEAGDGQQALTAFDDGASFDLVITDWEMPVMNGLELVQSIRATGNRVPIMMVTTKAERADVLEAIQAGINDYVIKPFERDQFREKLDRFVPTS
jgi:two-component system, chemotaxis family, chemotaxis protein CheY